MSNYILDDDYIETGLDLDGFKTVAEKVDNNTKIKSVETDCLTLLYNFDQKITHDSIILGMQALYEDCLVTSDTGNIDGPSVYRICVNRNNINSDQVSLFQSLKERYLINFELASEKSTNYFFVSQHAIKSLASKISVKTGLLAKPGYSAALFVAEGLSDIAKTDIVYRTDGKYNKIVTFVGSKYSRTQLKDVALMAEIAGRYFHLKHWKVTNNETEVVFEYKQYHVSLITSDNCECSDKISLSIHTPDADFVISEMPLKNISDSEKFFGEVVEYLDGFDNKIRQVITREMAAQLLERAIGKKASILGIEHLANAENVYGELIVLYDLLNLSDYQKQQYKKIFLEVGYKL